MSTVPESVEIDFLLLADRIEVLNGKLYMMGGAWDNFYLDSLEQATNFGIGLGVLVPWNLTNHKYPVYIHIENVDGARLEPQIHGEFTVGRPSDAEVGQSFRALVAINGGWKFPAYGTYSVVAQVGEGARKSTTFRVLASKPATVGIG